MNLPRQCVIYASSLFLVLFVIAIILFGFQYWSEVSSVKREVGLMQISNLINDNKFQEARALIDIEKHSGNVGWHLYSLQGDIYNFEGKYNLAAEQYSIALNLWEDKGKGSEVERVILERKIKINTGNDVWTTAQIYAPYSKLLP